MKCNPVKGSIFVFEKCVPACARKKKLSTQELWRPCLRSGYTLMMRSKTRRQVRETTENTLFQGACGVSAPRMQDLKSLQSGDNSQHLQAHTGVPGARLEVVHWHMEPFGFYSSCPAIPMRRGSGFVTSFRFWFPSTDSAWLNTSQQISTHVRGQGWGTPKEVGGPDGKRWFVSAFAFFPWFEPILLGILPVSFLLWSFRATTYMYIYIYIYVFIDLWQYVAISAGSLTVNERWNRHKKAMLQSKKYCGVSGKCLIKLGFALDVFFLEEMERQSQADLEALQEWGIIRSVLIRHRLLTLTQKSTSKK